LFKPDEETGRSLIHFHLFRKYFITTMTNSGIPEKFVDFYAGHIGELDRAYQKQTKEKLLEVYLKGEPYLRVYDDSAEEIAKTKEEIREATEAMRDIRIENLEMKSKLQGFERMQRDMEEIKADMNNYKEKVLSAIIGDSVYMGADGKVHIRPINHKLLEKLGVEIPPDPPDDIIEENEP
jgi:hypothetical protein